MRREIGRYRRFFELDHYRVVILKQQDSQPIAEASVKLRVNGHAVHTVAEGDGPVNALDGALRKALSPYFPEIDGVQYQHGDLAGWEVRTYLLIKYAYRCVYCGKTDVPFELDHLQPRSRGGSNRVSNMALSCHACNQAKGKQTAAEFGHPQVEARAKTPLKDVAAVNATRYKLVEALRVFGCPIGLWTGGRTRWNRARLGVQKTHALDALCVGELAEVQGCTRKTLTIRATASGERGSSSTISARPDRRQDWTIGSSGCFRCISSRR